MEISKKTVVVITGASSGIGRALAIALAGHGARLGLIARRKSMLEETARECRERGSENVIAIACDITSGPDFRRTTQHLLDTFGCVDVLVNNAGSGHFAYVEDTPDEQIESVFRVNVFALWYGTSVLLPHMRKRGSGHIINVSSFAGKYPFPGNTAYIAAKHAAVGFTRGLRAELAGSGVEASVVVPAGVRTDWALKTEGGPMLAIFEYEHVRGAVLAAEDGVALPEQLPLMTAEDVAAQIVELIRHPGPELYTHPGSKERVIEFERDPLAAERSLEPLWIANREGYERLRRGEELGFESET